MITAVKHVSIPVEDQDRAKKFYEEILGFKEVIDVNFGEGQRWIEMQTPGGDTLIVLHTPEGHEDRVGTFSNVIFYTEDVQKTYDSLIAKGVKFVQPPTKETWGEMCLMKDSEGNTFCLSSS